MADKPTTESLLAAALDYAARGYPVFPCREGGKAPMTARGFHDATADPAQIRAWWSEGKAYNVGLATKGLLVVDADTLPDGSPNPWLSSLNGHAADIDPAVTARTRRGGYHYIFRQPDGEGITSRAGAIADHVDTRADGGYIVVAPSYFEPKAPADGPAGAWAWEPGKSLPARDALPVAPAWLVEATKRRPKSLKVGGPAEDFVIEDGQRNATLTSIGGTLRRYGMAQGVLEATLGAVNDTCCAEPLRPSEVAAIARSVGRYAGGSEFSDDLKADGFSFATVSAEEFLTRTFDQRFFVRDVLVGGEHFILGGPKKALKTSIILDMAASLATGTPFLGYFDVPEPRSVIVVSGESGGATLQKTLRRVSEGRGEPFDGRLWLSLTLPNLSSPAHLVALEQEIRQRRADVVVVDPAYLALLSATNADSAGNVFKMGAVLKGYGRVGTETGCTMCLVHHTTKSADRNGAEGRARPMPGLADLSQSGFAEWARQWLLVNHRLPRRNGRMTLNMVTGGSAGHGGEYVVEVDEGQPSDPLVGRQWKVTVSPVDAPEEPVGPSTTELDRAERVAEYLQTQPEPVSKRRLTDALGLNNENVSTALESLAATGRVRAVGAGQQARWESIETLY